MKISFKNQLQESVQLSAGESEYDLRPEQEVEINLQDGDCLYLDNIDYGERVSDRVNLDEVK